MYLAIPMGEPEYSLLLPVRNEAGRIDSVVRSIFSDLAGDSAWEVCIADDCSDDGTFERLRTLAGTFPFRLLRPDRNLGRGGIRNMLAGEARGKILVFLDGDCRPSPGFFKAWEGLDPGAAFIGKVSYEKRPRSGFSRFLEKGSGAGKLRGEGGIPAAYFISQNFRLSKEVFGKSGGFRTDLSGWGGEDTDFGCKLERLGVPMRFRAEAEASHPSVAGLEAYFARLFHFGESNLPVLIEDHPQLAAQFKLGFARKPFSIVFLNPLLFAACRALVIRMRGLPWPYSLYRYVIFNCYARGFLRSRSRSGTSLRS